MNLFLKLIFTARSPTSGEISCSPPPGIFVNNTSLWIEVAHRKTFDRIENEKSFDYCKVNGDAVQKYLDPDVETNFTDFVTCSEFEHQPTFNSLILQYDLICSRKWLVALTQTFHLLGVLVGGIITHYLLKM